MTWTDLYLRRAKPQAVAAKPQAGAGFHKMNLLTRRFIIIKCEYHMHYIIQGIKGSKKRMFLAVLYLQVISDFGSRFFRI